MDTNPNDIFGDQRYGFSAPTGGRLSESFPTVQDYSIEAVAQQSRVIPRQVSTGQTRGEQQVKGNWTVTDQKGVVRIVMGYQPNGF